MREFYANPTPEMKQEQLDRAFAREIAARDLALAEEEERSARVDVTRGEYEELKQEVDRLLMIVERVRDV